RTAIVGAPKGEKVQNHVRPPRRRPPFAGGRMNDSTSRVRRGVLKAGAAVATLGALGFPAISRGQAEAIRIGHLTPLTGFLGPLGEYAVMGVKLAVEEINTSGGVMGRKFELIAEDSVNPQTASTKAA